MKLSSMMSTLLASSLLLAGLTSGPALADDGAITNKSMSRTIQEPTFGQEIVNNAVPEDEHAFTDMAGFYVPAQAASGEDCANAVETLEVAKPLFNVFIHGPLFEVEGTAFGHSFMDTYAAVSLDDGETWKQTNLSDSATESSFNIETDHNPKPNDPLPNDHTIFLGNKNKGAFHAPGYEFPYSNECTECHGVALQGTAQTPSCYSCHGSVWDEETPIELGPVITEALYVVQNKNKTVLEIEGENAVKLSEVLIKNGVTGEVIDSVKALGNGGFLINIKLDGTPPPCTVAAESNDELGPAVSVIDEATGEPIEECEGAPVDLVDYPGGTYNVFHAVHGNKVVAGNKVLVAWPSRFCSQGQPAYSLTTDTGLEDPDQVARLNAIVGFLQSGDTELGVPALPDFSMDNDLYLVDAFGVAGSQGSIDFADEGYPQAGVVPFGCVWTARGVLLPGDDPRTDEEEDSHMVWTKAERLTSGRRDPNRIEVHAVKGAGFVVTWQEDPEGLRPGQGLGPGEGWSGAVAHSQTDAWYSFINEEYFDLVESAEDSTVPVNILDHDLLVSGRPQVFVPMAIPMRLSNNAKCNPPDQVTPGGGTEDLYCIFEPTEEVPVGASAFGLKDQCADTVTIQTGNENNPSETEICVADSNGDGTADLPNRANTALTRPRTSLQGYDTTGDGVTDSAWVVMAAEESKGLGKYFFEPDSDGDGYAEPCVEGSSLTCTEEIGKNQWYFSFDMGTPDTSAGIGNPNSLVENLVYQGDMLNQGEVYWETGELFGLMDTEDMDNYDPYNFDILNTEIARRASLLVQSGGKAAASANKLAAISSWKQGVMRQGGPADTMLRRFVVPDPFDPAVDNPFAFANMVCEEFLIEPDTNPYYPGGVCADPATNLSGVVPDTCIDDADGSSTPCPTVTFDGSTYGIGDTNPILQGFIQGEGNTQRVLTWHQCPSDGTVLASDGITPVTCDTDDRTDDFVNLQDQSWYNPLDVSKGHRGFLDGDFVQFLYAWSPNWRLNAKGNDRYDLYVRRSFDGGNTWTVTPASFTASDGESYSGDGTVTCERYRPAETGTGDRVEPTACYTFAAGAAEHARNVTQHKALRITTLDPRFAPTKATITDGCTDGLFPTAEDGTSVIDGIFTCDDLSENLDSDLRNPSRYFMVYEIGDNTTTEVGEAEPLDLFYGRAEGFGDDYVVWTETDTGLANPEDCYPTVSYGVEDLGVAVGSGFCNEFDNMNTGGDTHASEANLESNPDGSKLYGVWAQWVFADDDDYDSDIIESDSMARRIWWIDDYVSDNPDLIYTLPGTQQPAQ